MALKLHPDKNKDKPECKKCRKQFTTKGNLKQHLKIHTGDIYIYSNKHFT